MKEIGVGLPLRLVAKALKPRVIISENDGKWNIKSENPFKTLAIDFIPGVEFSETTADGREVTVCLLLFIFLIMFIGFFFILKSIIIFEGNKWVNTTIDKNGKKSVVTRYVDDKGQQMLVSFSFYFVF